MYQLLQTFHSHNRHLILLLTVIVLVLAIVGLIQGKGKTKLQRILQLVHLIILDLQFTIGLVLYVGLSPFGVKAFSNPDINVMKDANVRAIAIEHLLLMLAAWVILHIGYSKAKKSANPNKLVLLYYSIGLALILVGIPWDRI